MTANEENEQVKAEKFKLSDLWKKEDWLSIWGAFLVIAVAAVGVLSGLYDFSGAKFAAWGEGKPFLAVFTKAFGLKLALTFAAFAALFTAGNRLEGRKAGRFFAFSSMPFAVNSASSTCSPTAEMTRSQGISTVSPVGTGLLLPEASGSPSFILSQISLPSLCATGATSSKNSTPSAMASSSSSASAGIYCFVRR